MEIKPIWFMSGSGNRKEAKTFFAMRALLLLTIFFSLSASSQTNAPRISLSVKNAPIEEVFKEIKRQSGYSFIYTTEQLKAARPVTLQFTSATLQETLDACFKTQPFTYVIDGKYIAVKEKTEVVAPPSSSKELSGRVMDETGRPVNAGTVTVKGSGNATATNDEGYFLLREVKPNDIIVVSAVGFHSKEVRVSGRTDISIQLAIAVTELDETVIIAYGTTTKRLNTGNVSTVTSEQIEKQPVSNPLAALQGRVPGVIITQSSGVPGSSFNVEIRGRSSLDLSLSRNDPLIVIDGVPFEPGNLPTNQLVSAANQPRNTSQGGLSPLNTISPSDIERIEVLKDADATAIYGSRGANGVILITTKKGKAGKTSVKANVYSGWSRVSRTMDMLNTQQYLEMRREAIANEGSVPQVNSPFSGSYAPDLLIWDTTVFTDFKRILIGNTASSMDAQLSVSGGNSSTQFLIGGNYHRESNVFSKNLSDKRTSFHLNLTHSPGNKNFSLQFTGLYSNDKNELIQRDLTQYINLPPNLKMYDSLGKPNWIQNGVDIGQLSLTAPAAEYLKRYRSINENLVSNLFLRYRISNKLTINTSFGFNQFMTDEVAISPRASLSPFSPELASSNFGNGKSKSWIVEPQAIYTNQGRKGKLDVLLGATIQEKLFNRVSISASNYTSDLLLFSAGAAGYTTAQNNSSQYRYLAIFNRITYNWADKYIVNLTARRDGSSRFGPGNQFANFGAFGGAWLFSNEPFLKNFKQLSFGKLRGSYGVTGNDQIGDYKFLDLWNANSSTYQGTPGLQPSALFNPDYKWEKNRKLEIALEAGFFKNRVFLSASLYRNRSSNQLINYKLPDQTGFSSVVRNFPAVVQNSGLEILLNTKNINGSNLKWSTSVNITLPKNKLVSFPDLASSSYATTYVEGQPLNIIRGYKYLGVDPATGVYMVEDLNKDNKINSSDNQMLGNTAPKFYGGIQNTVSYKGFDLSIFFEGRKQIGRNYLAILSNNQPGIAANQPTVVLNRWQRPGDISSVQRFTDSYAGAAAFGAFYLSQSNGIYSDASFIRLKNIQVSYSFPERLMNAIRAESSRIYIQAQNPFVITSYLGSDPEIRDILTLPVLKTIAVGFQVQF